MVSTRGHGKAQQLAEARGQHLVGQHSRVLRVVDELRDPIGRHRTLGEAVIAIRHGVCERGPRRCLQAQSTSVSFREIRKKTTGRLLATMQRGSGAGRNKNVT